jgi:hypothetical protein
MVARTKRLVKATAKKLALARAPKSPSRVRNSKKPPRESAPALVGSDLVGAIVEKWFKPEWFKGKVVRYNEEHKWYWVEYEDGDEEEMNLRELREVLIWVPGQPKLVEHDDDLDMGFRLVGFEVLKRFGEDEFAGVVVGFDRKTEWYRVVYEDDDQEEMDLEELKKIIRPESRPADVEEASKRVKPALARVERVKHAARKLASNQSPRSNV